MTDDTAITNTFTNMIDDQQYGPDPTGTEPAVFDEASPDRPSASTPYQTAGGNTGATEIEDLRLGLSYVRPETGC